MDDKTPIIESYKKMYKAMIAKDADELNKVLDGGFVLVHMTGMRQSKQAFIRAVLDETLNYYSAVHENMSVEVNNDTAIIIGQSYVAAAVFGGGRSNWRLQQKCSLKKVGCEWKITESIASTY